MSAIAYLKTDCERCGGHIEYPSELAGESTECPHCRNVTALPAPFTVSQRAMSPVLTPSVLPADAPRTPVAPSPNRQDDEVFFSEGGILVSKTRFVVDSQIFALAGITSVRGVETPPNRTFPIILLLLGAVSFVVSVWLAAALLILSIAWLLLQKAAFTIVLTTASGEVKVYKSNDSAFILRIVRAVTEAIVARG